MLSVLSVTLLLILFLAIFRPIIKMIDEKKIKITNQKIENINNREKERNLDILQNRIKQVEPQLEKLDSLFVRKEEGLKFIMSMEEIAKRNMIDQTIDVKQTASTGESQEKYKRTPIEINASGDYSNIFRYLDDLESMSYYFNIEELSLTSQAMPGENANKTSLHLVGLSYWE
jgi:Tfp pilus assembly protein PilO